MKFSVGRPVGGPATFTTGTDVDNPMAEELLELEGVVSMFMTADFVTITKSPGGSWEEISPGVIRILENHFDV